MWVEERRGKRTTEASFCFGVGGICGLKDQSHFGAQGGGVHVVLMETEKRNTQAMMGVGGGPQK